MESSQHKPEIEMTYAGHLADGGGIQKHSAGGLYPYVIGIRERLQDDGSFLRTHFVTGPKCVYFECPTDAEAVAHAEFLLGRRLSHIEAASRQWQAYAASRAAH